VGGKVRAWANWANWASNERSSTAQGVHTSRSTPGTMMPRWVQPVARGEASSREQALTVLHEARYFVLRTVLHGGEARRGEVEGEGKGRGRGGRAASTEMRIRTNRTERIRSRLSSRFIFLSYLLQYSKFTYSPPAMLLMLLMLQHNLSLIGSLEIGAPLGRGR